MNTNISSRALDAKARIAALKAGQKNSSLNSTGISSSVTGLKPSSFSSTSSSPGLSSAVAVGSTPSVPVRSQTIPSSLPEDPLFQAALATNQLNEAKSYLRSLDDDYQRLQAVLHQRNTIYTHVDLIHRNLQRLRVLLEKPGKGGENTVDEYWSLLQQCRTSVPVIQAILRTYPSQNTATTTTTTTTTSRSIPSNNSPTTTTDTLSSSSCSSHHDHHHHDHHHHHADGTCTHLHSTSSSSSSSSSTSIRSWQDETIAILTHIQLHIQVFTILYYLRQHRPIIAMELCRYLIIQYPYYLPFWFFRGYLSQVPLTSVDNHHMFASTDTTVLTLRSTVLLYQFHLDKCIRLCNQQPDYMVDNYLHTRIKKTLDTDTVPTNDTKIIISPPPPPSSSLSSSSPPVTEATIVTSPSSSSSSASTTKTHATDTSIDPTILQALDTFYPMYRTKKNWKDTATLSSPSFTPSEQFTRLQDYYRIYLPVSASVHVHTDPGKVRIPIIQYDSIVQFLTSLKHKIIATIQFIVSDATYYHENTVWLRYTEQYIPVISLLPSSSATVPSLLSIYYRLAQATLLLSEGFAYSSRLCFTSLLYSLSRVWLKDILPKDVLTNTESSHTFIPSSSSSTVTTPLVPFHHQLFNLVHYLHRHYFTVDNEHCTKPNDTTPSAITSLQLFTYSLYYYIVYGLIKSIYSLEYVSFSNEGQEQNKYYLHQRIQNMTIDLPTIDPSRTNTQTISSYDYTLQLLCEIMFCLSRKIASVNELSTVPIVPSATVSTTGISSSPLMFRYHPLYHIYYIYASCTSSLGLFDKATESLNHILPVLITTTDTSDTPMNGSILGSILGGTFTDLYRIHQLFGTIPRKTDSYSSLDPSLWFGYHDNYTLIMNTLWNNYYRLEKILTITTNTNTAKYIGPDEGKHNEKEENDEDRYSDSIQYYRPPNLVSSTASIDHSTVTAEWILKPADIQVAIKRIRYLKRLRSSV